MSHIVIHDDGAGVTQYRPFDELEDAVAHIERLHNEAGVTDARLFALHEVPFSVHAYVKVEIGGEVGSAADPVEVAGSDAPADVADDAAWADDADIEYVDASALVDDTDPDYVGMAYVDGSALADEIEPGPEPDDGPGLVGEPRRGLFGR